MDLNSQKPKNRGRLTKNQKEATKKGEKTMTKTYTLPHNHQLDQFPQAHLTILNPTITDIWNNIQWKEKPLKGQEAEAPAPHSSSYTSKKKRGKIP